MDLKGRRAKSKFRKLLMLIPGGRVALRIRFAWKYFRAPIKNAAGWAFSKKEDNNFYYKVSDINRDQIIHACTFLLKRKYEEIDSFVRELEGDRALKLHIHTRLQEVGFSSSIEVDFGRRIAW